ncbi:YeeE/YedE family protein [Azoarcus sp. L1K30]|uniref:YeeE/YedE family protein n=1 Tax=Azoarcus sp. L1K30 TaxID=2820277 RepID=UPI001B819AFD|nr:YeeE/YedE family protein [Azoarcus sp. L1K30]MBR0567357.1 YeeE/YedE family protein [Azoarcus sp. L1K30]
MPNLLQLIDWMGEDRSLAFGGLLIGALFGACAQRSRFCLRAAVVEVARGQLGAKLSIWLLAFSAAIIATQSLQLAGMFDTANVRQLSNRGSLSGALVGGLLFGAGMILARGCSSRLLVLAANGNLRALLSGLIFAVTAQASMTGILSPLRESIGAWWTISGGGARDLLALSGLGHGGGLVFGLLWLLAGAWFGARHRIGGWAWAGGIGAGVAVAFAWWFTFEMSARTFDPTPIKSLSFTGPSADVLMRVLSPPGKSLDFDLGMVPGVVLGSFLAALSKRELKLEGFQGGHAMRRYIAGAVLMGFGGMLAGGCAVGAGISGASVFALTAWITLSGMWAGASLTDWIIDRKLASPSVATMGISP